MQYCLVEQVVSYLGNIESQLNGPWRPLPNHSPAWFQSPAPPHYSPDLSPCDFFLFPKLSNVLNACHFGTLENI